MNNEKIITWQEFLASNKATNEDIAEKVARSPEQMQADRRAWRESYIKRMDALFSLPEEKVTTLYNNIRMRRLRELGVFDLHAKRQQDDDGQYSY